MNVDEIITLDDNKEYLLILDTVDNNNKYYLAAEMINNEPSNNFLIFKEIDELGQYSVEEVEDQDLLEQLIDQMDKKIDEINVGN